MKRIHRLDGPFVLVVSLILLVACSGSPETRIVEDSALTEPSVTFQTDEGRQVRYLVELAISHEQRARGLMGRSSMKDNRGMLFVSPVSYVQKFWMKDTPLSLDIIFIGSDMRIVGIVENTVPFDTASIFVPQPSKYVLEIKAGQCAKWGLVVKTRVHFEGFNLPL